MSTVAEVPKVVVLALRLALDPIAPVSEPSHHAATSSVCASGGLTENHIAEARKARIQGEHAYTDTRWFDAIRRYGKAAGVGDLAGRVFATSSGRVYVPVAGERTEILALRRDPGTVFRVTVAAACANAAAWVRATGHTATAPDLALAHTAGIDDALRLVHAADRDRGLAASEIMPAAALEQPGLFFDGAKPRTLDGLRQALATALGSAVPQRTIARHATNDGRGAAQTKPPTSVAGWRIDITRVR